MATRECSRPDIVLRRANDGMLRFSGLEPSLSEVLDVAASAHRGDVAIDLDGDGVDYRALWHSATRIAGGLVEWGVHVGDRLLLGPAFSVEWAHSLLGTILAGGVPVVVAPDGAADPAEVVRDCGALRVFDGERPHGPAYVDDGAAPDELALLWYSHTHDGLVGVELTNENVLSAVEACRRGGDGAAIDAAPSLASVGSLVRILAAFASGGRVVRDTGRPVGPAGPAETTGIPLDGRSETEGGAGLSAGIEYVVAGPGGGELLCRGPSVARGYWNRPALTGARFRRGWFHTGTTAAVGTDGQVRIVDPAIRRTP
ncbi:AMP-binding protein [Rhodococcus sp. HNM0569]|uniref:AMP-binding protein n=1 Tax=Rhodococcus sp. HNM0569 TaxID=2716340 RepID=UPI00146E9E78|nr:AMP-binding protein [Rhodococcus sp. HNM0569]NLU83913.1 long-chain fatty acid--CoA ligase [Rhodococcus sp. HNM0569]